MNETVRIVFVSADGELEKAVNAPIGGRLLDIAQDHDQPLEGTCEGQMACSTCHVHIDEHSFAKLPAAMEMEEDMLDFAADVCATSRLACQIWLTADLKSMRVKMPTQSHNMQGV